MAPPPGVTVYPTSYDWQHNPYAYHGQGREFGPDSAKDLGEASPAGRGSSYYFGFLITFAILLIVGVCCGIAARRRRLVRRQQRGVDGLVDRGGLRRFGGLIGMDRVEEDNSKTEAKVAPKFHDIKLNVGKGDSANGSWRGDEKGNALGMDARGSSEVAKSPGPASPSSNPWAGITPLSVSMVRSPRDLEPYGHLHGVMNTTDGQSSSSVGDAPPPYWTSHTGTGGVPVLATKRC
ncbi:hypothetical protein BKA70DRAFT_20 [Coprinopsis sp. MPI-PUGE-AT-0042]|nr:hypothetical protein BKA70DRAFT_20 [Coprinopsis sp. MPI-PUGE-AT-0042]